MALVIIKGFMVVFVFNRKVPQATLSGHHSEALLAESTSISPWGGASVKPKVMADFKK